MTKTYHSQEVATIQSIIKIEFKSNQIILEHKIDGNDFDDDDSSIFLYFNTRETKNLFHYYKTDSIEDLIDHIHQHFTTYNSLKDTKTSSRKEISTAPYHQDAPY